LGARGFAAAVPFVEWRAIRVKEAPCVAGERFDGDLAFVNQPVMRAAQRDEIGELMKFSQWAQDASVPSPSRCGDALPSA
jgi:hypothetical protein